MQPSDANFCHPYRPYDIQLSFMSSLYDCIEQGKVGIFESPTGTGKSLSLICGSLTWLRDNQRRGYDDDFNAVTGDQFDWLAKAEKAAQQRDLLHERQELEVRLLKIRKEETRRRECLVKEPFNKKLKRDDNHTNKERDEEDQFVLDEYESESENGETLSKLSQGLSTDTQALLNKLKRPASSEEEQLNMVEIKIIFCSRTHSQLTQFVHELERVTPPRGLFASSDGDQSKDQTSQIVKHLPLGSRNNLCINKKVLKLSSTTAINDRCIDLQKPGTSKDHKCPYLPSKDDRNIVNHFRDRAIATIRDIEDIRRLGKEMRTCPYYASRSAVGPSEILTLPYPLLLQRNAREALGVSVKDNIVVIDEAHNLMDAVADTLSVSLRLSQLHTASMQVTTYVQRFKNKLKGKNRVYVTQVIRLLNSIIESVERTAKYLQKQDVSITGTQLMSGKGVDQIKPHKILRYLQESKLTYKVEGYTDTQGEGNKHKGILMAFQSFLAALMNPVAEGRFFVSRQDNDVIVKYTLLDPREHFRDIVEEARAVILAGGTMSPMSDYADYLFSYLPPGKLQTFSFGHVIPPENMYAEAVTNSPSGVEFDFTFAKRSDQVMILELGWLIIKICQAVPDGVVAFFPSYDYLHQIVQIWRSPERRILDGLSRHKKVFEETKGAPIEDLLRDYAQTIDSGQGGLLLSVVGGRLSEGINFSDRLGRAVIVVGLPFPNANSAEWKAKIEHVEATKFKNCQEQQSLSDDGARAEARAAGRDFYENSCMRAVNQSIGRAIRHKNDYAAILLVDRRFATDRIRSKLPGWIRGSMAAESRLKSWTMVDSGLRSFFGSKS